MAMTKEQLLAEFEDLLRTIPPRQSLRNCTDDVLAWRGRAMALVEAWDFPKTVALGAAFGGIDSDMAQLFDRGHKNLVSLLQQARFTLRSETVGPLSAVVGAGAVFDYFDEVRKVIELAAQDVFFVDPYLDAEFVSRYLPHVGTGVPIRLLAREKMPSLLSAVAPFAQQTGARIEARSAPGFHDRFVFVDRNACYISGGSFKDGAKKAPVTLNQVTDAFATTLKIYEDIWASAKIHG